MMKSKMTPFLKSKVELMIKNKVTMLVQGDTVGEDQDTDEKQGDTDG